MATDAIVKKIARDFRANVNGSTNIRSLQKKLRDGVATYKDANKYAMEISKALDKALAANLTDGALTAAEYKAVVAEALPSGLEATYGTVSDYTKEVQLIQNKKAGINLKAVVTKNDGTAIATTTQNAVKAADYSEASGAIKQDTMQFAQNITIRMMRDNAGFLKNVGYDIKVERIYDDVGLRRGTKYAEPCEFCINRAGEFDYDTAIRKEVFARHPGCGCTIIYNAEKGPQLQTGWNRNEWESL